MTTQRLSMSPTPGDSLRPYFTSQAAATKGSYNLAGVANPAIDALVDKAIGAETRDDLTIACRALDRVFRAGRYWVPQWYRTNHPDRLLGSVRASAQAGALRARHRRAGQLVARRRPRPPSSSRRNSS